MGTSIAIARKELVSYFSSPVAYLFLGIFLFVSLFTFFWVDAFFARNIVDVRPLFEWMPLLMIFLVASLTMRMWSEERRMGTIEFLMTMPITTWGMVCGKFLACVTLVAVGLILTVGIPLSVCVLGPLDLGPVIGAYIAALLLAAAYCSIGLCVSALSENQIVSLLLTIVIAMFFYMLGSETFTGLLGTRSAEWFALMSTGARFESITRGVLDIRDLYYYGSITGVFLSLNVFFLERQKWDEGLKQSKHLHMVLLVSLLIANLLLGNVTLLDVRSIRKDLTSDNRYTISEATRTVVRSVQEPLLIRGYFSNQTHPLLAPLVPQIRDMLEEYKELGDGRIQAEFIDPRGDEEQEREAQEKYGIKPLPFQVSERYRESLVSSYFNVLVQYGDKFEVLDFRDMIEVKTRGTEEIQVQLRNLEYDITRTIKKVVQGFQTTDSFFESLKAPVQFTAYISGPETLPEQLQVLQGELSTILDEYKTSSKGKFEVSFVDPYAENAKAAKEIQELFGFRPMAASMFDQKEFYFYMMMSYGDEYVQVPLPKDLNLDSIKRSVDAALKRFSPGFLKTIGMLPAHQGSAAPGQQKRQFSLLADMLQQDARVVPLSLHEGIVSEEVDVVVLPAPEQLGEKEVFALDQFLMKGGTIVLASSPIQVTRDASGLHGQKFTSGLEAWLQHHGISMKEALVMDRQNAPFPVPRRRNLGGYIVEELEMVPYAPFLDVRGEEGMNSKVGIAPGISQVTINWAAPIEVADKEGRQFTWLLKSSPESWTSDINALEPDFESYPGIGFKPKAISKASVVAGVFEGTFESYFKDKKSPLLAGEDASEESTEIQSQSLLVSSVIEKSPQTARIILFSSNDFLNDYMLQLAASAGGTQFMSSVELVQNTIDWSLEDRALLPLRGRAHFSKTLPPLEDDQKLLFELFNYAFVLFGLFVVFIVFRSVQMATQERSIHSVAA